MWKRIYTDEPMPEGYDGTVKVLSNLTTKELVAWYGASLGTPGCGECAKLEGGARCPACTSTRLAFGASIVLIYGPSLLGADVSTTEAALAAFDADDWLPSELVTWLWALPDAIRARRVETIVKNVRSSSGVTASS